MKLLRVPCLAIILIITTSHVLATADACCPSSPSGMSTTAILNAEEQYIKQLQEQHTKDLQIMYLLIAIVIALSGGIILLGVIFLRKRNLKTKPNPES